MNKKIILLTFLMILNICSAQVNIYVSTTGLNTNNGMSLNSPVKTLQQAKNIVANFISPTMTNDIVINILGGEYIIDQTINFDINDSGQNNKTITYRAYQNQIVKLSSGKVYNANEWVIHDVAKNIWKLNIGTLYSRQVYVSGIKAVRATSKDSLDSFPDNYNLLESTNGYFSFCNTNNNFNWSLNTSQKKQDIEVVSNNEWVSNRVPIQDKCQSQLNVNKIIWNYNHKQQFQCGNKSSWIENAYDLIDLPNEWYIDRFINSNNILYFKTPNNQPPQNLTIPLLESLIVGINVNNLIFEGLTFQFTKWNEPSDYLTLFNSNKGLALVQADWFYDFADMRLNSNTNTKYPQGKLIPAAAIFFGSNKIYFTKNNFENLGGVGLQFLQNCSYNKICSSNFKNICASAITLGYPEAVGTTSEDNLISNNLIDNIATEYNGSVGIFVSRALRTKILNNEIKNFPYSGISIGWGWKNSIDYDTGKNEISNNKINCSAQTMNDTGAIYTLGRLGADTIGNRTIINNNYIVNYSKRYGAIYLDQGSSNIEIENNIIELQDTSSFKYNFVNWFASSLYDTHNIYSRNNYFSEQYPFPLNSPQWFEPIAETFQATNINISATTNVKISLSNLLERTTIINNSGIQLTPLCQY